MNLAVSLWIARSFHSSESTAASFHFRFKESQKEEIDRGYLQIASDMREKEREQPVPAIGEDIAGLVVTHNS